MRLAPACRKRLSDLQPDQGIAISYSFLLSNVHRFGKKITGPQSCRRGISQSSAFTIFPLATNVPAPR
ncbi:hypothetical protein CIW55_01305 [Enterobacter cloacae]|nr:hypothetical protein CIW55_01305 [Enterobacter cloacae]PAO17528.1 hypothetical protein CIW58_02280 [Enterobacter cloacae]